MVKYGITVSVVHCEVGVLLLPEVTVLLLLPGAKCSYHSLFN